MLQNEDVLAALPHLIHFCISPHVEAVCKREVDRAVFQFCIFKMQLTMEWTKVLDSYNLLKVAQKSGCCKLPIYFLLCYSELLSIYIQIPKLLPDKPQYSLNIYEKTFVETHVTAVIQVHSSGTTK